MIKLCFRKILIVFSSLALLIASILCINFYFSWSASTSLQEVAEAQANGSKDNEWTEPSLVGGKNIFDQTDIHLRTNFVTGFTSIKTANGDIEYALCDIRNGNEWRSGVVALNRDGEVLGQWVLPDQYDRKKLENSFTSAICLGNKENEIFVLLAVKDMVKAINNAYNLRAFQSIYIVKLKFNTEGKTFNTANIFEFSYPGGRISLDKPYGWFSQDGRYHKASINPLMEKQTDQTKNYYVGSLGYIHFLAYGHLFGYNGNVLDDSIQDEFIMLPALIGRDQHVGGLYSPSAPTGNDGYKKSSFSYFDFWKSLIDIESSSFFCKTSSDLDDETPGSEQQTFSEASVREIKKMIDLYKDGAKKNARNSDLGSILISQPGWCVFCPTQIKQYTYVSSAFNETGIVSNADFGGVFTQFEPISNVDGKRVFKAVRLYAGAESAIFPKITHLSHFTADWDWFSSATMNDHISYSDGNIALSDEQNETIYMKNKYSLKTFNWEINYRSIILHKNEWHYSVLALNESYDQNKGFEIIKTNFVARAATDLGTNVPFLMFTTNNELKVHTAKIDRENAGYYYASSARAICNINSFDVRAIVPFKLSNLRGDCMLVVGKRQILTYRAYEREMNYQNINSKRILKGEFAVSNTYRSIYFHSQSKEIEENLVRVSLGISGNKWENLAMRTFSLEWQEEFGLLCPLQANLATTIVVKDNLPENFVNKSTYDLAELSKKELTKNFLNESFYCEVDGRQCLDYTLSVKHVASGNKEKEKNRIALCFKIKIDKDLWVTGFITKEANRKSKHRNTYVTYSGLIDGQKYFAVFKTRGEVKNLPISSYSVDQVLEMYNDPKNIKIREQLTDLVKIDPTDLKEGWKYNVRVVDANKVANTLSVEALLSFGNESSYLEPLKIKDDPTNSIKIYSDVFYKPDHTWIYIVIAVVVAIVIILSLGLGIGIPMRKQSKINMINARITHRRIDRLGEAVSTSMKKILEVTSSMQSQQAKLLQETRRLQQGSSSPSPNKYSPSPSTPNNPSEIHGKYQIPPSSKPFDSYFDDVIKIPPKSSKK